MRTTTPLGVASRMRGHRPGRARLAAPLLTCGNGTRRHGTAAERDELACKPGSNPHRPLTWADPSNTTSDLRKRLATARGVSRPFADSCGLPAD
jgi:hypothetical protein